MNRFARAFVALGLAAAVSTALAAPPARSAPVMMTDAQMDNVTAGDSGLITVNVTDALNNWNIDLQLKVQANVLANVNAGVALVGSAQAQQLIGTQTQITGNLQ
jgi:hypothetical protein